MLRQNSLVMVFMLVASSLAYSQKKDDLKTDALENLRREIQQLRQELDSLKTVQQETDREGELDRIEERFERQLRELENKIDALSRSSAPTAFNPRTTAFINFAARADNHTVFDAGGEAEISDRPFLRTVELDFRAPVDPYAEAVTIHVRE